MSIKYKTPIRIRDKNEPSGDYKLDTTLLKRKLESDFSPKKTTKETLEKEISALEEDLKMVKALVNQEKKFLKEIMTKKREAGAQLIWAKKEVTNFNDLKKENCYLRAMLKSNLEK